MASRPGPQGRKRPEDSEAARQQLGPRLRLAVRPSALSAWESVASRLRSDTIGALDAVEVSGTIGGEEDTAPVWWAFLRSSVVCSLRNAGPIPHPRGLRIGGMATRLVQIAMNARDDSALGRFWAEALGWTISSEEPGVTNLEPEGFTYPDPIAVCIDIIAVPEPKTVKNRVHVDLATTSAAHQADLVARLQDLGATPADVGQGDVPWTVLADPEGNEFCVLEPRSIHRDTGPIAAVVADCADPRAMARFWGEAMDWTLHEVTDDHAVLRSAKGVGPYLKFLRTSDTKTVKNRTHLDLRPYPGDDQAAEVARLRALGATDIDVGQGDVPWTCLADPEGNEFDVLTPR
jgi:Glyoxalase-like domain